MTTVAPERVIWSITQTLEKEVLPAVPMGWPASYLRSAIMLLTYMEDRLTLAPELLAEDESDLRLLLEAGASAFDHVDADPDFAYRLRDAARATATKDSHENRRAALCDLIVAVYERPGSCKGVGPQRMREAISHYREQSLEREDRLWRRAELLPLM
ncbi:hypothetical protein Sphch_3275 [Sphingobium chlorophenolicum L-1]|uniref:Uncharacterized protein n=1 Tax=Sphingobium chlorophenolicum L-1 TaxID=690566 RepID=F6F368_SPHCR|nr:hypothetical protein [Sphingobium chlorophenolicum]AEG50880.1 hypothetical protein Sphch_3275 [Sphingobium chlorophenolicum L-1]